MSNIDRTPYITKFVRNKYTSEDDNKEMSQIMDVIDRYRVLSNMTWRDFILTCMAEYIKADNPDVAQAILIHIKTKRKAGRPRGSGVKQSLRRMGVNPDETQAD